MSSPLTQIKEIWTRLPMTGRIATVGGVVATLGLLAAIIFYGSQSEYAVLFSDLKPADAQTIVEKLKAANVPYSLTNGGTTIQIPTERVSEMRLQIASAGVLSGGHVGFDLFDKTNFGATDFAQQVNFRRAIEGELAKTLEGMDELDAARVHITPKKESVFTEKEEGSKASVMLRVRQGKELSDERTEAIVSLISSSVEGLDPSSVSVMDTRGRLLTAGRGKSGGLNEAGTFNAQLDAKRKYETETAARVISLLEPVAGDGHVRADVAADVDFSQIEQTEEKYNPQSQVIRSQQSTKEARTSTSGNPSAVVGARSNDPTSQPNSAAPTQQTGNDQRGSTLTNYEIDKTTKRTVGGSGRVNRLTVSVVVDHKIVNDTPVARTADELKQIQDLVAAAVGTNEARGDSVVVQTMPFDKSQMDVGANAPSWLDKNKQLTNSAVKYGALIVVALLLLFFVLRPAKKALMVAMAPPIEPILLPAASESTEQERRDNGEGVEAIALGTGDEMPQIESMMTVAELEAKMQTELEPAANVPAHKIETVRKSIVEQTISESEMVAGTLRGWLRE